MKITIRQLNGCLSTLQLADINPESQEALKELIQTLVKTKRDHIEIPEDDEFGKAIIGMSKLHTNLVNVQKHNTA